MRREEAFKKYKAWRDLGYGHSTMPSSEVLVMALDALHPITREQVEKVWFGCDICREDKEVKSDNFCGAATMRIVGDSIDLRRDEKKIKFFGHIYAPSFSVRFCPFCGKPLTDEAVEMVTERMNKLYD